MLGGFPRLVREEWRLVLAAALLFFGPLLLLIAVLQAFPDFVHYLLSPEQIASFHEMYDPANRRLGMREADTSMAMFGFYIWNNVRIGFQTFAGGLAAGVGSAYFLGANGVIIGAVAGYLTQVGYTRDLLVVRRRPHVARAARDRAERRRGLQARHGADRARQQTPQSGAGGRGAPGGAHHVRRGDHVLRRRFRRGFLVADHRVPFDHEDRGRHRRLGRCCSPTSFRRTRACSR